MIMWTIRFAKSRMRENRTSGVLWGVYDCKGCTYSTYEVRIKWINTSLKFSKEIIKVVLINISKLRLLFTVSSTWWSIPDWSIILQHLPSVGQWQTMSLLQDHNVRPYDVHKNKIWSSPHDANPIYRFTQKRFHVIIISSRVLIIVADFSVCH